MTIVKRANVILQIKDDQVDRFVSDGYDVIDETGKIIQKSVPKDVGTLQKAYADLTQEIKDLKAENEELKETIKSLKKTKRKTEE